MGRDWFPTARSEGAAWNKWGFAVGFFGDGGNQGNQITSQVPAHSIRLRSREQV